MSELERLLTTADVAEACGVTPATVQDWVQRGKLTAIRLGGTKGGRLRFREAELRAKLDGWSGADDRSPASVVELRIV